MPHSNKKLNIGIDWDGVGSEGFIPSNTKFILTGREPEDNTEINVAIKDIDGDFVVVHNYPNQDELTEENMNQKIGVWKGQMIKKLGIDKFYEDTPEQISIIKEMNPKVEVIKVTDGVAEEKINFIFFTNDGCILPIAKKLQEEGNTVVVGMVDNTKNLFTDQQIKEGAYKPEDPKKKKLRLKTYKDILSIHSAEALIKEMKSIKDKDKWFIMSDSNSCFRFCQQALDMGFTNGYFPTEKDRDFEENRMMAKKFVKDNYTGISEQEVHEFKDIESAKEFLMDTDKRWVLKGLGDSVDTFVPQSTDLEQATEQVCSNLDIQKSELEKDAFILEEMIEEPIEVTPQLVFYNGEPVYYSLDLENKPIGSGNVGFQVGCAENLICHAKASDKINQIAFPPAVFEMAKKHKGMFIWDMGLLIDKNGKIFFTEFCSNRTGWDAFPTELSMCQSLTLYFTKLMAGLDPLEARYGAGVRVFNITYKGPKEDVEVSVSDSKGVFLYDVYDNLKAVGNCIDLGCVTGFGDSEYEAIQNCYENVKKVTLESLFYRPMFDFTSCDYSSSILNRYRYVVEHNLISYNNEDDENKNNITESEEGNSVPTPSVG